MTRLKETFGLESLPPRVDLEAFAAKWGVVSVEHRDISSDAMLLPGTDGYKVILKKASTPGEKARQRFSFAHELGHLLLNQSGYESKPGSAPMHRSRNGADEEERLCDQIAAEILMPRTAFALDASNVGWSLQGIRKLTSRYGTSVPATARRMVALMPEQSLMGTWKPASSDSDSHKLQDSFGPTPNYGVPNARRIPRRRHWLIARADKSAEVECGVAPVINRSRPSGFPIDVPAEAWAWGKGEYRRVVVFYYPKRLLSDEMKAVANATWRPV